jgi:hypothetical protein
VDLSQMNLLAVLAAALSAFLVGGLWYSPLLFGKVWMAETGLGPEELARKGSPGVIYGVSFVLAFAAAFILAMFLGPAPALPFALGASLAAGIGWVGTSFGINYLFERKSLRLFAVNAGYHTVQYGLMGLVLGAWH